MSSARKERREQSKGTFQVGEGMSFELGLEE